MEQRQKVCSGCAARVYCLLSSSLTSCAPCLSWKRRCWSSSLRSAATLRSRATKPSDRSCRQAGRQRGRQKGRQQLKGSAGQLLCMLLTANWRLLAPGCRPSCASCRLPHTLPVQDPPHLQPLALRCQALLLLLHLLLLLGCSVLLLFQGGLPLLQVLPPVLELALPGCRTQTAAGAGSCIKGNRPTIQL